MARKQAVRGFGLLAGTAIAVSLGGAANAAGQLPGFFTGSAQAAMGMSSNVAAELATSAQQFTPCQGTDGKVVKTSLGLMAAAPLHPVFTFGGTSSATYTNRTANAAVVDNWSEITNLSLLGGIISAKAVKGEAKVTATKSGMTLSTGNSSFTNLKIAGKTYTGTPAPNTVITLPSIGTVTLNAQEKGNGFSSGQVGVNMISLKITNPNGFTIPGVPVPIVLPLPPGTSLPSGAVVNIGHAVAGYNRQPLRAVVSGSAFGTLVANQTGPVLMDTIGRTAQMELSCAGTGGQILSSQAQSVNALNVAVIDDARSTAQSGVKSGGQFAKMTSTVQSFSLLGGLIKGTNLRASAQETLTNGNLASSTAGSGFDQMTIAGIPIPTTAKPNTGRALPGGLGTVMVNEQIKGAKPGDPTIVNGLHIKIAAPNALKLPVGVDIYVAHAAAGVAPPAQ